MSNEIQATAKRLLKTEYSKLTEREQQVIHHIVEGLHISRSTNREYDRQLTFGQRLADRVAAFGGSWPFILIFGTVLFVWVALNSVILAKAFDPYPYILLNLVLSMLAAIQAPIIMMSQNRHAAKDRLEAAHDYETNLKAELEIRTLHEKIDGLRQQQWLELIALQQEQIKLLTQLLDANPQVERE